MSKSQVETTKPVIRKTRKRKPNFVITVKTQAVENESDLTNNVFAFTYSITIENRSTSTARLINRHWKVYSAEVQIADVKGEGVVGQQPVLKPNDSFEYSSWTVIKDPIGTMKGEFTFLSSKGDFFDIAVPEFNLTFKDRLTVH